MSKRLQISIELLILVIVAGSASLSWSQGTAVYRIEPRALNRMIENQESPLLINVASYLECMDARIPASRCMSCELGPDRSDLFPVKKETRLVFYGGNEPMETGCRLIQESIRQGFSRVYILKGGLPAWKRAGYETESIQRIPRTAGMALRVQKFASWLKSAANPLVLDIRAAEPFKSHHIKDALNIPLSVLHLHYQDIPLNRSLLIVDDEGSRSFLAASYLSRKGFSNIMRMAGGMASWDAYVEQGKAK